MMRDPSASGGMVRCSVFSRRNAPDVWTSSATEILSWQPRRGVTAFTLLLSPVKFAFSQPVKVVANGRTVFEGRVERNYENTDDVGGTR
jgi:hypothetical protein